MELQGMFNAASIGDIDSLRELSLNADLLIINSVDNEGTTALSFAAASGHATCLEHLIKLGAALDVQDNYGNTALILAAYHGYSKCVMLLAEAEASLDLMDNSQKTALQHAEEQQHIECIEILRKAEANENENEMNDKDFRDSVQALDDIYSSGLGNFLEIQAAINKTVSHLCQKYRKRETELKKSLKILQKSLQESESNKEKHKERERELQESICVAEEQVEILYREPLLGIRQLMSKVNVEHLNEDSLDYLKEIMEFTTIAINQLVDKQRKAKESQNCCVCLLEPKTVLLLPCKHLCVCTMCAENIKRGANKCPLDQQFIAEMIDTFT